MKKYEITNETHPRNPKLKRIRALKDFSNIKEGDLGGYIQFEKNLSQKGDCWVSEDAQVSENAKVSEDAKVSGNAEVNGKAWVNGSAKVYGNAWVSGNAEVSENAKVSGCAVVSGLKSPPISEEGARGMGILSDAELEESKSTPEILDTLPEDVTSIIINGVTYTKKTSWVAEEK